MAKTKKIIQAGPLTVEALYPRVRRSDGEQVRAAKHKASSAAQARINKIYSWQKLRLLLAANFPRPGSALVITLTYADECLPESRKQAERRLRHFRKKLADARAAQGRETVAVWSTENKHGEGRYHHHVVVNATGDDYALIRRLWTYGRDIEISPLRVDREKNYDSLARYMTKEPREKLGLRSWSCSRNARKPESETFSVPDDTTLAAPEGAVVLLESVQSTAFAEFRLIEYLVPVWDAPPAAHARRRRKGR